MKIAVAYDAENETVFEQFRDTEQFKVYETNNSEIVNEKIVPVDGSGEAAVVETLNWLGMDVLICGGIGEIARTAVSDAGIQLYGGMTGAVDDAVNALFAGELT